MSSEESLSAPSSGVNDDPGAAWLRAMMSLASQKKDTQPSPSSLGTSQTWPSQLNWQASPGYLEELWVPWGEVECHIPYPESMNSSAAMKSSARSRRTSCKARQKYEYEHDGKQPFKGVNRALWSGSFKFGAVELMISGPPDSSIRLWRR